MQDRDVILPLMRIAAVVIVVLYFEKLAGVLTHLVALMRTGNFESIVVNFVFIAFHIAALLIAAIMWFFPEAVARRLGLIDRHSLSIRARYAWLEGSLLAVIGVYLVAQSLIGMGDALAIRLWRSGTSALADAGTLVSYNVIHSVVQLVFGLLLMIGARHIPIALRRFRRWLTGTPLP